MVADVPASEQLFVCGDWNGHIGTERAGYEDIHGGHAIGRHNDEGERLLEFANANDLVVGNSVFEKQPKYLVTYQSGDVNTQIDFLLYRRSFRRHVTNVKVILGEECASQHRLLVRDFKVTAPCLAKRKFIPKVKLWKLRDPAKKEEYTKVFNAKVCDTNSYGVEGKWKMLRDSLHEAAVQVCGVSKKHHWRKETWWWDEQVESAVKEKRKL